MNLAKRNQRAETAILFIISALFLVWCGVFVYASSVVGLDGHRYYCLFDDAMISMRYAWNLAHGLGLVWNAGERVEGYTNLLMTLLMALPALVFDKSTAVLTIQIAGVGIMLGAAGLSVRITNHITRDQSAGLRRLARMLAFLCALAYYPLSYWTLMGMETGLLTVLLLAAVLAALQYADDRKPGRLLALSLWLGLAFLTRNDSMVFAVLFVVYATWATPNLRTDRQALYALLVAGTIYALFVIGHFAFNRVYYGEWLPNTYVLKVTGYPVLDRLSRGARFVAPFLVQTALVLAMAVAGILVGPRRKTLLLLALGIAAVGEQIYVGGDPWSYWRIMAPTVPLLAITLICGANNLAESLQSAPFAKSFLLQWPSLNTRGAAASFVTGVTLLGMVSANWNFLPEFLFQEPAYQVVANQRYVNVALAVSQVTTAEATVGVFWAGSIPYYTGRRAIDFLGKSDAYIARLPPHSIVMPGHDKYDLDYSIKTLRPTFVQYFTHREVDLSGWAQTRYSLVEYGGIELNVLRDSPAVLWDKVRIVRP